MTNFYGNTEVAAQLGQMAAHGRIPQALLLHGPAGVGKATLTRRFAALLLPGGADLMERDDLSLAANVSLITDREKLPAEKRNEDPLFFSSHPDFVTFPPEGPLRQISIPQMRLLKERAGFQPVRGSRRVFLVDRIDRANEQAANSLLKILEEPPPHLILCLTAENPYDLLPTIRSRTVSFALAPLSEAEMRSFVAARGLPDLERRLGLAGGSPGMAVTLDLEAYTQRRATMLILLEVAAGQEPFGTWVRQSEGLAASKSEKLEHYLDVLYLLLEDILLGQHGMAGARNRDVQPRLEALGRRVSWDWLQVAVRRVDELVRLLRRNIQKTIALDALVLALRTEASPIQTR